MILAKLMLVAFLASAEPEPSTLVERLGSGKYAEREAAMNALVHQGRIALAALRKARDAKDPEVRLRAVALVEKIESDLMVRPTMITLDYQDKPLVEVVKGIGDQARIHLVLNPENSPMWQGRRITLKETQPVTFWTAIDKLCKASGLQSNPGVPVPNPNSRGPSLALSPGGGWLPGPNADSGPFRVFLTSVHYHKDVMLGRNNGMGLIIGGVVPPQPPGPAALSNPNQAANASEQFYFQLQVVCEPRLMLSQNGQMKVMEAADENGQSLLPTSGPTNYQRQAGFHGYAPNAGMTQLQLQGFLKRPEHPGKVIKTLRGMVPVAVSARRDDPLVIDLADAKGKTFKTENVSLTVHEVKTDQGPANQGPSIELSVRNNDQGDLARDGAPYRMPSLNQSQMEILDAKGHVFPQWYPTTTRLDQDELRVTIRLLPFEGVGAPSKIRYFDLVSASSEASFEFHDIAMP
jgi:hypothetical protein